MQVYWHKITCTAKNITEAKLSKAQQIGRHCEIKIDGGGWASIEIDLFCEEDKKGEDFSITAQWHASAHYTRNSIGRSSNKDDDYERESTVDWRHLVFFITKV